MQRWHVTLGLSLTAAMGLLLAPRLLGQVASPPPTEPAVADPIVTVAPPPPVGSELPLGHLVVSAGLDRTAVLAGDESERFLTITVSAPSELGHGARRPVDLSVVMDVSGSMAARGKMEEARRSAKALAKAMGPEDTFSLVVFNDDATTVIPARHMSDLATVTNAIDRIYEGGGTNLYAGMDRGAEQVRRSRSPGVVSRMVVLSDGNANIGITDPGALSRFAADLAADDITVSTVGMGLDFNEDLLAHLADVGGGNYRFVAPGTSMEEVFRRELANTSTVVGQGTTVHVELPPEVTPVDLVGWNGTRSGNGWDVFVGDVYAGSTKKVVARVRVRPARSESLTVAAVDVKYLDIIDSRDAHTPASAAATVTTDRAAVLGSANSASGAAAARALGSWYLDQSTRAWEGGNLAEAEALAASASQVLRSGAADYAAPDLLNDAAVIEANTAPMAATPPTSEPGRIQSKKNKEIYRDNAH